MKLVNKPRANTFVTGRVKPIASIIDKANKRQIPFDRLRRNVYDIAGLRMMCHDLRRY